jgi:hypothetical protein
MAVMRSGRILVGGVALQADAVAGRAKFGAVGLMAIAAGDASSEHLALLERAVIIDLVEHLPVSIIEPAGERRDDMSVRQPPAGNPIPGKFSASRMAQAAGFDFPANESRCEVTLRISSLGIDPPDDIASLVEANDEALPRIVVFAERPPALPRACPGDVVRALAVAGLATHADFRKARGEAIVGRIVILVHAGRVALGAHEIPVLVELRPVQHVVVLDLLVRIEMEPALSALLLGAAIPGDRQRLEPAVRKFDEILL